MLFNSYEFIFVFLPVSIGGYFAWGCVRKHSRLANVWLLLCSLFFYGYWDVHYLPLLIGSILLNYAFAAGILWMRDKEKHALRKAFFVGGLLANLVLLGYFKYFDFLISVWNHFMHGSLQPLQLILPLGISFFTITQILYLIDCCEGVTKEHDFLNYALFVSFFPHLLCGPILFHKPMMAQFHQEELRHIQWKNFACGLAIFIIGLAKKVLVADSFVSFTNAHFYAPASYSLYVSWLSAASYIVQLYFDFSGYSDMAVGVARMMNIRIPINFNSPFRSSSLTEFWQRWHISLTQAITACVYIPLMRMLPMRFASVAVASFLTFFVVGIWHGAGWTFVIFALLHATGVTVNQIWRHYRLPMPRFLGKIILLVFLIPTFVIFRSPDMTTAFSLLLGMTGHNGFSMEGGMTPLELCVLIPAIGAMLLAPNSNEIVKALRPSWHWVAVLSCLFLISLFCLGRATDFLYFQF